ncbi:MAG TPA: non-ribosomal peptide synthetase [Thermoanaerobaculia bacterium]|jgi:acyl-CoA synthetase (AMP-forming)/AMP-acid ligase II/thioesterase domain-containing protein/acyl carrier protein
MAVTISERFRQIVAMNPDALALVSGRGRHTYAELDRWSDAIAAGLLAQNLPRDRPVALVIRDHVALVPTVLGVVKAGHFFVVIDANEPDERRQRIVDLSGAVEPPVDGWPWAVGSGAAPADALRHRQPIEPNEYVQLLFTSGTTGQPKGIITRQRLFVERNLGQAELTGRAPGVRVSYTALPGFARATYEVFGSLLNGATLCAFDARAESLDTLAEIVRRERVAVLTLTPALFRRFMFVPNLDVSSVKKLRIGADVMTVADVEAYKANFPRGCTLERGFNASETGIVLHMRIDHDTPIPGPLVPVGRPRPDVEIRLIDEEGNDVPDGETGELVVRGPYVVEGYWNDPELTAQKFILDGSGKQTFFTGDLLRRDADGLYYFVGRKDSRLKIHGRRVDPLEIESALTLHGGVREAVVVGRPDTNGELQLVAYVVSSRFVDARAIRLKLRSVLPAWMIPTRIFSLERIPMTPSGKVDRGALWQTPLAAPEDDPETYPSAADPLERTLLDIWSRVLGSTLTIHDDFFNDLGGTSIAAAHLVTEVQRLLGRALPLSLLLELNTVARMADYLRTKADLARIAVVVQPGDPTRPPVFCVSGKGGSVIVFRPLAALLGDAQPFYGLTHHGFAHDSFPTTFAAVAACYADAIRSVQPEGPYFLAGYSAGGLLAYEIARYLTSAGAPVAFLGLIDTAAAPDRAPKWRRYMKHLSLLRDRPAVNLPRYARAVGRRARALLDGRRWTPPPPPPETAEMNRILEDLRKRENLHPYSGRVTLFVARHGWGAESATLDLGWSHVSTNLEIIPVPGEHHTVLREDVGTLAAAFREAMAKARG